MISMLLTWTRFESIASQIEDNPDVVDKLATLVSAFALNATKASSPPAPATKAVAASSGSTDALGSGDTLQHIVELAKLVAPKAKQWVGHACVIDSHTSLSCANACLGRRQAKRIERGKKRCTRKQKITRRI